MGRYATASEIINRASRELGIGIAVDPFQSQDSNFQQLVGFLTSAGQELIRSYEWPHLTRQHQFTTTPSLSFYDLPDDFMAMIDQSGWNRTSRFPLGGPLSPQEWQYLKAAVVGVTFNVLFRIGGMSLNDVITTLRSGAGGNILHPTTTVGTGTFTVRGMTSANHTIALAVLGDTTQASVTIDGVQAGFITSINATDNLFAQDAAVAAALPGLVCIGSAGTYVTGELYYFAVLQDKGYYVTGANTVADGSQIELFPTPVSTVQIAFEYRTRNWVQGESFLQDAPDMQGNIILLDPLLMTRALKVAWKAAHGFDTGREQSDFDATLSMVLGQTKGAPRLSLNGARIRDRFLDGLNIPITGLGS